MQQALAKAKREQQQQYDAALSDAKTEINNEAQANLDRTVSALNQEWSKTRNLLIGITTGAVVIGITALIVAILT